MFGRAAIRLGIGPHSSYVYCAVLCAQVDDAVISFLECCSCCGFQPCDYVVICFVE